MNYESRTDAQTTVIVEGVDFYTDLKKISELTQQGLLTEQEFQTEKRRLLRVRAR